MLQLRMVPQMELRQQQKLELSLKQELCLKKMLSLRQVLKHPEIPNATKGLEGMKVADDILKSRNSIGVLIGGISEMVWNKHRKKEDLLERKDVDVMVMNDDFILSKDFEGGIDWWQPANGDISVSDEFGDLSTVHQNWWRNGNGIVLYFGVTMKQPLNPGLHIPGSDWVIDMREAERVARFSLEEAMLDISSKVRGKFRKSLRKEIERRLPFFIKNEFAGQILDRYYESDTEKTTVVEINSMNRPEVIGVERFYGR